MVFYAQNTTKHLFIPHILVTFEEFPTKTRVFLNIFTRTRKSAKSAKITLFHSFPENTTFLGFLLTSGFVILSRASGFRSQFVPRPLFATFNHHLGTTFWTSKSGDFHCFTPVSLAGRHKDLTTLRADNSVFRENGRKWVKSVFFTKLVEKTVEKVV